MSEQGEFSAEGVGEPLSADVGMVLAQPDISQQILEELPFLRRVVRRWHANGADADDLVQDTVLRGLENCHQLQPDSNLRAWLFTIMRNRFLAARARSQMAGVIEQIYAQEHTHQHLNPNDTELTLRDVQRTIKRMPRAQSIALTLVGVEGKSYKEVAQTMALSVGAVRCHLARARARLRNAVDAIEYRSPCLGARAADARRNIRPKSV